MTSRILPARKGAARIYLENMQAQSKFVLKNAEEKTFSEIEGGPKLTQGRFLIEYQGEL